MNNNTEFKPIPISILSSSFESYIELKRATGLKYISEEKIARYFVRFCQERYD